MFVNRNYPEVGRQQVLPQFKVHVEMPAEKRWMPSLECGPKTLQILTPEIADKKCDGPVKLFVASEMFDIKIQHLS